MISFPFSAIVGLEQVKKSLICHAIDPRLGGTLLMGHRGCAKSTMARAFGALVEPIFQNGKSALVEVPLGVTEDRLLGSMDAGALVQKSEWKFLPGLLEQADGGVLYLDEVNLLPDSLADLLLDAAATGSYHLEREGISRRVETRFILLGSMNPEEGELRPQFVDRFAHCIQVRDEYTPAERADIVRHRMAFDVNPETFHQRFASVENELREKIREARARLAGVILGDDCLEYASALAVKHQLEGMRGEIAICRTACALAALEKMERVIQRHVDEAWELCAGHRISTSQETPPPRTPPSSASHQQPQKNSSQSAPLFPKQAGESVRLSRFAPVQDVTLSRHIQTGVENRGRQVGVMERSTEGRIDWRETLIKTWMHRLQGGTHWQLIKKRRLSIRTGWVMMDASRSSGANDFYTLVSETLPKLVRQLSVRRVRVLMVYGGRVFWLRSSRCAGFIGRDLKRLAEARGESPLVAALGRLRRQLSRFGGGTSQSVWICSDGLTTLREEGGIEGARAGFRSVIRRLSYESGRMCWLYPEKSRGVRSWLEKLTNGFRVDLIPLRKEES